MHQSDKHTARVAKAARLDLFKNNCLCVGSLPPTNISLISQLEGHQKEKTYPTAKFNGRCARSSDTHGPAIMESNVGSAGISPS